MSAMTRSALALMLCSLAFGAQAVDKTRVADEGKIGDEWMLAPGTKLAAPGYTQAMKDSGDNVCVGIGYSISPEGKTGDFTVLKSWSSRENPPKDYFDQYAASAALAVSQWQFQPRPEITAPRRTVTVATMTFRGTSQAMDAGLAARCKIADLAAELQKARHEVVDQSRLRRDMEAQGRAATAGGQMVNSPGQSSIPTGR